MASQREGGWFLGGPSTTVDLQQFGEPRQRSVSPQSFVAALGEFRLWPSKRLFDLCDGVATDIDDRAKPVLGQAALGAPPSQFSAEEVA
jgi:hypothetical protein